MAALWHHDRMTCELQSRKFNLYSLRTSLPGQQFGDRTVILSGKVQGVRETLGVGFVSLVSLSSDAETEVGFDVSPVINRKLAMLREGMRVEVMCDRVIEAMSVVVIGQCTEVTEIRELGS